MRCPECGAEMKQTTRGGQVEGIEGRLYIKRLDCLTPTCLVVRVEITLHDLSSQRTTAVRRDKAW